MTNIVFLDRYSLCDRDLSLIESLGRYTAYDDTPRDKVAERLADADVAIANKVLIDGQTMRRLPRLKLICVAATGMNNIDLDTAAELGIEVRNAVGYSTYSVAETTLCSALALMREAVYFDEYFKSGRYAAAERMFCYDRPTRQLRGRNWGIIGLGNIGREVARLATAFGCRVSYFSTSGAKREEEYPQLPLGELLAGSDIVSIHSPLNDRTRGLIGREELSAMKPAAILINVARGGIVESSPGKRRPTLRLCGRIFHPFVHGAIIARGLSAMLAPMQGYGRCPRHAGGLPLRGRCRPTLRTCQLTLS